MFLKNENGKFQAITIESGLSNYAYGLGIAVSDNNEDGIPDLYI